MNQPFKKIASEEKYSGTIIRVRVDTVRYQGKNIHWEIVEQGRAVVVLPLLDHNRCVLINQYRYTVGGYIWELPAGRAHAEEPLEECAQRELEEECRYRARRMQQVLTYYPSPGVSTEIMHLYIATDLYEANTAVPDEDEIIKTGIRSFEDIEGMIHRGEIQDAKTILAFLYFRTYGNKLL